MNIKVKKLTPTAILPTKAYDKDLCWDLYCDEKTILTPSKLRHTIQQFTNVTNTYVSTQVFKVPTNICISLPLNYGAKIFDRSSLASKGILTCAGVIDNGYTDNWLVCMYNLSDRPYTLEKGSKIAQFALIQPIECDVVEVDELHFTERSNRGFGSSGK